MSRLSHDTIWYQYHKYLESSPCPICGRIMRKDDHSTWNREHIIRQGIGGPDIYPNLIPICEPCNKGMGKKFHNTYEYLVYLEKITTEHSIMLVNRQKAINAAFDPICCHELKNGSRCKNLKGGKDEIYCWKHINEEIEDMDCGE